MGSAERDNFHHSPQVSLRIGLRRVLDNLVMTILERETGWKAEDLVRQEPPEKKGTDPTLPRL